MRESLSSVEVVPLKFRSSLCSCLWVSRHTFNYILHLRTKLLFLCLSDETSTPRECFRYLEVTAHHSRRDASALPSLTPPWSMPQVVKNSVLLAVRDLGPAPYHSLAPGQRGDYAVSVRQAFQTAVTQYLQVGPLVIGGDCTMGDALKWPWRRSCRASS
jgi:hypothetical protein